MEDSLLIETRVASSSGSRSDPPNGSPLCLRKIEFLPAKKAFKGFDNGNSEFKLETLNKPCSFSDSRPAGSGSSAMSGKKNDASELSEYGLDPELCFGMTFRKIGAGLRNLGNTCFLNSVLQCLTYTEPLAAYLQSGKHKNSCQIAGFCALCAIQNHVSRALQSSGRILSPEALVVNLRRISRNFRNARQEDAHEYMVNLLESMHKCCLPSGVPSESPSAYEKSLVHKIFGGRLRSQVKCQQCSHCSNKFDPFIDLSLEIFKADSLHKALGNFTASELLDGGEKQYQCQQCKQKVRALKQLTIHKAPYVLAIHLKRFHAFDPGQKIKKKVQFGCALDLKPFVSGSYEGDLKYSLYGVLVHSGHSTHSGHYYCYVRTSNNMWYTLDDNRVSHVSEQEVLNQQAYMLFYVRDKKSLVLKRPVEIAKKDNIKMNVNTNGVRALSTLKQGLDELVQKGSTDTRFSGVCSSTAEAPKNTSIFDPLKVSLSKDEPVHQVLEPKSEASSHTQSQKDSSAVVSVANSERECLSSLDPSVEGRCHPHDMKVLVAQAGEDVSRCNEDGISKEKDSLSMTSTVDDPENAAAKLVTNETSHNDDFVTVNLVAPEDSRTNPSNSTDPITSLMKQSNKNRQAGGSASGSVSEKAGHKVDEKAVGGQALALDESVIRSLHMDSSKSKCLKRSKKKLLKYQVSSMHLGSNFFFMASLVLQKKKYKYKRRKCHSNYMKNLNKKKLDQHTSSNLRPSTYGVTEAVKSVCKKDRPLNSNKESLMQDVAGQGEFRKRIRQNSAVPAAADQIGRFSECGSLANQREARHTGSLHDGKRDQMHNDSLSLITGNQEETIVARWDDIELPPSQYKESRNDKIVSIGYIGNEWDEEYDRGKRKKLKSFKHNFGVPNPFQEIATKKSQSKRAKVNHSSSGSPPFRI